MHHGIFFFYLYNLLYHVVSQTNFHLIITGIIVQVSPGELSDWHAVSTSSIDCVWYRPRCGYCAVTAPSLWASIHVAEGCLISKARSNGITCWNCHIALKLDRRQWQWQGKDIYCQSFTQKISQSYMYTIQLKGHQLSLSTMKSQLWQWGMK